MKKITPTPKVHVRINDLLAGYVISKEQAEKLQSVGFTSVVAGQKGLTIMQAVALCNMAGTPTPRTTLYNLGNPNAKAISLATFTALWVGLDIAPADLIALK